MTTYFYDDDGRLVRSVTRQTEPEWDDAARNLAEGLARYDAELCPGCGIHPVIHDDPRNAFTFDARFCNVCASQDVYGRVIAEADDKATPKDSNGQPKQLPAKAPRPSDGRFVFMRRMSDDEVEHAKQTGRRPRGA